MGLELSALNVVPKEVEATLDLVARLDVCLMHGLARLGSDATETLASVGRILAGTPLGESFAEAAEGLGKGEVKEAHIVALACARAALHGACYDALEAQALAAVGRAAGPTSPAWAPPRQPADPDSAASTLMHSSRQWLLEVGLAGFQQLDRATVQPFVAVIEEMERFDQLVRLVALLTSFVDELLDHVPTAALEEVPGRRWADVWTRAVLLSTYLPPLVDEERVDGDFRPLGAELRVSDHVVSMVVYGVAEVSDASRLARLNLNAWKVNAVSGEELWALFGGVGKVLLKGLTERSQISFKDMRINTAGDLFWSEKNGAKLKSGGSPNDTGKHILPAVGAELGASPFDRHPAMLAVPVHLEGCTFKGNTVAGSVTVGGAKLPLALERLHPLLEIDPKVMRAATECTALLRFDRGEWRVQPLVVRGETSHERPEIKFIGGKVAATLRERASKLLRS